jgi:predicted homoserine dehydrogenase-like protein
MIILDKALERRHAQDRPIRVALVGAGFMGRGIALQIGTVARGIRLVAIASRRLEQAAEAYAGAGVSDVELVETPLALLAAMQRGRPAITTDWRLLCEADGVEVIIEATGSIEYGAHVVCTAIECGKHILLMNADLDGTVGPLLKRRADTAGVIFANTDGDQPGVIMNLYRFVRGIGLRPVVCGNTKGLQDPYRTPATQVEFARRWGQQPHMVTSFADGTKVSYEQAIIANATGMRVGRRGMFGPEVEPGTPLATAVKLLPVERFLDGPGIVDYVVGAAPAPGVFVLAVADDPRQKDYLAYYQLGDGPTYLFYTPYHLCHFEVPNSVVRAVDYGDAAIAPAGPPQVEVVATAKTDLKSGATIDGVGYYMTYGQCENADIANRDRLLPMGIALGCRLLRDIKRDEVLTYDDVELPTGRLIEELRAEQKRLFFPDPAPTKSEREVVAVASSLIVAAGEAFLRSGGGSI